MKFNDYNLKVCKLLVVFNLKNIYFSTIFLNLRHMFLNTAMSKCKYSQY